ncbi:MAG: PASTA domain-containing protein [Ruminococcus sp.]|nr:PASTA domain-containing protein [Candidatus Copronaster equi]
MSCMKDIGNEKQCPYCGFHTDSRQIEPYLPIRTVLGNRYIVGKLLEYNGDGATYMGLDISTREPVNIREYFPEGVALRDPKTLGVVPSNGNEGVFNECLQSFIEMWRKLMKLSGLSALIKVQDILEGNGTCYAITENIDGITLREYLLRNNEGYISWENARALLMPVLSTLGTLHSSGIIHRGISPQTLIVAPDGKIRITGFSIGQVRSSRSELKEQLFSGYSAYEQYSYDGRQGTWTDIYAFCAVLYRSLIGTDPIDAVERMANDRLMVPGKFAEQLPAYVINGLVNALQILPEDRTRDVDELRAELSASPRAAAVNQAYAPAAPVQPVTPVNSSYENPVDDSITSEKRQAAERRHSRSTVIIVISSILIVLAIAFVVLWQTGVIDIDLEKETTVSSEMVDVPNFIGKSYDQIINDEYFKANFKFEKTEAFSADVEEGNVISQSASVNEKVAKGSTITLTVSKGRETVIFPTSGIVGAKFEVASKQLTALGFKVMKPTKDNLDDNKEGTVESATLEGGIAYPKGTLVYLMTWGEPITTTTEPSTQATEETEESDDNSETSSENEGKTKENDENNDEDYDY